MTPPHQRDGSARAMRAVLRSDLTAAMKDRDSETITALRTAIAAIDNAEAVEATTAEQDNADGLIAHAGHGVGSTDVARRELSADDVAAILRGHVDDYLAAADRYAKLNQHGAAAPLRRQAHLLQHYLQPHRNRTD